MALPDSLCSRKKMSFFIWFSRGIFFSGPFSGVRGQFSEDTFDCFRNPLIPCFNIFPRYLPGNPSCVTFPNKVRTGVLQTSLNDLTERALAKCVTEGGFRSENKYFDDRIRRCTRGELTRADEFPQTRGLVCDNVIKERENYFCRNQSAASVSPTDLRRDSPFSHTTIHAPLPTPTATVPHVAFALRHP